MPEAELSLLFLRPLNQAGIRYIVSGGVAAIFYGEPRMTSDVDLVVFLRPDDIRRLSEIFPMPEFYVPPVEVLAEEVGRVEKGQFNLLHAGSGFRADCYATGRDELNAWGFRNARRIEFQGEMVTMAPPEYVIVRKLEFLREGGSDKHLRDIRTMLRVSAEQIDQRELAEWIRVRGVQAEWDKVITRP